MGEDDHLRRDTSEQTGDATIMPAFRLCTFGDERAHGVSNTVRGAVHESVLVTVRLPSIHEKWKRRAAAHCQCSFVRRNSNPTSGCKLHLG